MLKPSSGIHRKVSWVVAWGMMFFGHAVVLNADGLDQPASWQVPSVVDVRGELLDWVATMEADQATLDEISEIWAAPVADDGQQLLRRVMSSLAMVDQRVARLLEDCENASSLQMIPEVEWLGDGSSADFVANNVRLYVGRWYSMHQMYNESLESLEGLQPSNVVDPASLLFHRSVAHYRLRQKTEGLKSLASLLENRDDLPKRYSTVADLMLADLETLEEDSLDEIARIMDSVRVRLGLGRAGTRVRDEEDEVVRKLDKLIEQAEQQRQQMQQQMSQNQQNGGSQPNSPLGDSMLPQMRASGDAGAKKLDDEEIEWGNLPPKERQEALQSLGKEFPSHYREVIEEYFRSIAQDGSSADE